MRLLSRVLSRPSQRTGIEGQLGYFGLGTWWTSTFSPTEREYIESASATLEPPAGVQPLTTGGGLSAFPTAAALLTVLADRLSNKPEDRSLARRVLAKAEERALAENDVFGLHFTYHQMIRLHSRWKEHFADALDLAFAACHKQIRLAPQVAKAFRERSPGETLPTHLGYLHAANTLEQRNAYLRAIEICRQAESEGWSGNWSWRIRRMAKKLPGRSGPFRSISESGMGPV
jgi:hypothetical protein